MTVAVQCIDVVKSYGDRRAVDGLSMQVAAGQVLGVVGPNGAGKTTLLGLITGILQADRGQISVQGRPMTRRSTTLRGEVGYVPQEIALYPEMTGRENLEFFGRMYGLRGAEVKARAVAVLAAVELTDRASDRVEEYSGGMKRRLNVGVALMHEPSVLLLDEPTVGMDPQSRSALLGQIRDLAAAGAAVIVSSHYLDEVAKSVDDVLILDRGRVVEAPVPALATSRGARAGTRRARQLESAFFDATGSAIRD